MRRLAHPRCRSAADVEEVEVNLLGWVFDKYVTAKRDPQWHADQQQFIRYRDDEAA